MNNKIAEELMNLGIYKYRSLQKDEYDKLCNNNNDISKIYISGNYKNIDNNEYNKYYREIDTDGLSMDEIRLLLDIDKTKNIRSIKSMITFFVVVFVIALVCMFIFGMSNPVF